MSNSDNYQKINFLEIQTCFCSLRWLPECWFSYCCGYYICESVSFQGFHISGEWRIEVGKAKITQTFLFLPRFNCSSLRNTFCITVSLQLSFRFLKKVDLGHFFQCSHCFFNYLFVRSDFLQTSTKTTFCNKLNAEADMKIQPDSKAVCHTNKTMLTNFFKKLFS